MILEVKNLAWSYGGSVVLKDVSMRVDENDRIGIIGQNGCGKTTMLKCITGELPSPDGAIFLKNRARIGYLAQTTGLKPGSTILSEMQDAAGAAELLRQMDIAAETMAEDEEQLRVYEALSAQFDAIGGYDADFNIARILNGMAFPEESWHKSTAVLSGGEKTRLALAKLLVKAPDLLILDEPTNHLDVATVEWLEEFMLSYKGAALIVSHDRWFLDKVTNRTVEINGGKTIAFDGGYTEFVKKRDFYIAERDKEYRRNVKTAERLQEFVDKNIVRASTSNMAKSRIKMIERLDLERPDEVEHEDVRFVITPASEPFKDVLLVKDVAVAAGGRVLIEDINFLLERGDRLAIVGENGAGKTTFLRAVAGETRPYKGFIRHGGGVSMSYFKQNLFAVTAKDPMSFIWDHYPQMTPLQVRNILAAVGFRGDDVFTDAAGLSGGELAKLNLALISLQRPNLLVLDEPTDHLDIYTKEKLDDALADYTGTIITVSHDRWFLKKLGAKILAFEGGKATLYESYDRYLARNDTPAVSAASPEPERKKREDSSKEGRRERARRREELSALEKQIAALEAREEELNAMSVMPENIADHQKLAAIFSELQQVTDTLAEVSDRWLSMLEDAE